MRQSLFLNKIAGLLRPALYLKRDSGTGVFLGILRNFQLHFLKTPLDDCFCISKELVSF